ncbi:MAG: 4Fe-4S dicluster domain-containing protein, partial [Phycisphaerae bacterium]
MTISAQQSESPGSRRDFFWRSLGQLLHPIAEFLSEHFELLLPQDILRPPGALPERELLRTCYRCGNCVDACPAGAIQPLRGYGDELDGTPWIDADVQACVVCDGLSCMKACPSGALQLVAASQIRMGLARVGADRCLRAANQDCTICIEKCPIGERAIGLGRDGRVEVFSSGCVGCGVCQMHC